MKTPIIFSVATLLMTVASGLGQTVAGIEQLENAGSYTNAQAASANLSINGIGPGYFISDVKTHFLAGDFYSINFADLTIGQDYQVTILVGNYSSTQQSFGGFQLEDINGMSGYSQGYVLSGPVVVPGTVGWSDGNGAEISWLENTFSFTATDTTASALEFQDGIDYSAANNAANAAGYNWAPGDAGVSQIAIGGISIAAIPEPSSAALLGLGALLGLRRKR